MENLWELIAEKRGLKIGEKFKYSKNKNAKGIVNFIDGNYMKFKKINGETYNENGYIINSFIAGEGTIEKLPPEFADPIRCEYGGCYKTVSPSGKFLTICFHETSADLYRKKAGNMFALDAVIPQEQIDKIIKEMKE